MWNQYDSKKEEIFPSDVRDELKSRKLWHVMDHKASTAEEICITVYENQKFRPFFKGWGSELGVHLSVYVDRAPFTDETGKIRISNKLHEIHPVYTYQWQGEWEVVLLPGETDEEGFQYASGWSTLCNKYELSPVELKHTYVRRRRWRRRMVLDTDPSSESLPYELILKIKKGTLPGFSPNFSSVETYLNNQLYDASPMGSLEFNRVVEFKMMSLDIDMVITLTLFTKRSPSSTSTARGSVSISLKEFRSRVNTGSNDFDLPFLPSGKTGGLLVGVEVREKQLFCIESTMPPLLRELSSLKEIQLSSQLKRKVYAIDNASKGFLHLILSILTEDADLISEAEVYDITNDVHLMLLLNEAGGASYRKMVKYFYADTLSTNTAIVPTILYPYTKRRFRSLVAISSSRAHKTFFKAIRNSVYDFNHKFQSQELSASSYLNLVNERQYLCEIDTTIVDSSQGNPNSYDISLHCNTGYTYEIRFPYFCDFSNVIRNLSVIKQMLQNDDSSQKEMDDYYTSASLIVNDHGKLSEDEYDRASYTRNKAIRQDVKLYLNYSEQALSMRIAKYHQNSAQLEDPSTAIIIVPFKTIIGYEVKNVNSMIWTHVLEIRPLNFSLVPGEDTDFASYQGAELLIETIDGQKFNCSISSSPNSIVFDESSGDTKITLPFRESSNNVLIPANIVDGMNRIGDSRSELAHVADTGSMEVERDELVDRFISVCLSIPQRMAEPFSDADEGRKTLATSKSNGFVKQAEYANSRMSTYRSSVASVSASFSGIHLESSAPVEPTIRKIFGEKNLPISDYDMLNLVEEDRELSLDCSYWRTSYRLNILKLERSRTTALNQINVFYKLFFADASGKRIVHSFVEKGKSHKYFYKSSIVSKCINAVWNEEVNIAAEKYGSHLSEAKFICVELWDNVGIKSNSLLGELLVPLHSIEQADECNKPKLYAVQPPHSSPNSMKENCNAMGVLMIKLAASSDNTVDAQPKETATMKLVTHLRPIRSTDFSWPCRIISYSEEPSSSRLEDEVYHITLGTDGIRIIFVPSGRAEPESGRLQMLKTCQENNRFSNCDAHWGSNSENKSLDMIVPYSQVKGKSLEILTDSMLHLTFTIYRRLGGNSGGDVNKNYNYQNMSIDMIVGPCPALDFDTVLQTRISLYSVWCAMKNTMSYQDNTNNDNSYHKNGFDNDAVIDNDADVTAIDAVVKKIQGEIFSCVAAMEEISLFLHQSKSAKSTHVEAAVPRNKMKSTDILSNKSEHTQSVAHSTYNIDDILAKSYSIKQVNSQRVPSGDSSVIRTSDCSERNFYSAGMIEEGGNNRRFYQKLRIFVYRKAFLQVYLWYLVEFSSLFTHVNSKYSTDVNFDREYLNSYVDRTKFILAEDAENLYLNGSNEDAVSINNFGLIRHEDINLELSPQSTGRNDDPSTLIDKLELIMKLLQSDVRHFIMLSINKQATLSSKTSTELASILSSIIYKQYLAIVEYVSDFLELSEEIDHDAEGDSDSINNSVANSNVFSVKKSKPAMNPQRKRNLITFLISQDNLFELYLNPMLVCSKYKFSSRPFLSKCINFEQLLNKFYVLLNQNLTMWNARTVGHFLGMQATNGIVSNAAFSGISNGSNNGAKLAIGVGSAHGDSNNTSAGADKGFLPWEVTTLTELSSKRELFISNIPETVQTQLNIQIGLKKIPTDSGSLSSLSIKRIIKINQRIASSIAKAYLNIAGEYERVLNEKMNELFLLGRVSTVGKAKSRKDNRANSSEVYDDVIMFLISIVNDCCRINSIHIPEGVQAFVDDGNYNNNNYFNSSSKNNRIMLEQSNPVIYKYFFSPSKAYTSVARSSINYLSNQLLFNTELRGLLLNGLEKEFVDVIGDNGSCESGAVGENSCVEVMSATIIEFFEFVSDHLDLESLELLVFVVFLKWIMRYLLFLRDLQRVVTKSGKSKTTQQSDSATGFDFSAEAMNQHKLIKSHLRIILQTFCALQSLFVMKSGYGWSSADVKQQDITIESTDSYDNRKADMESSFRDSLGSDESGQKPNSHRESISDEIITIEQLFSLIENPPPPTNRSPDNSTPDHVSPEKDRVIYWTRHAAAALSSFSSIIATYISREFHSDEQANGGGNDKKKSSKKNKYINEAFENAFTNLIFEDLYVVLPQYQTDSVYLTAIESWLVEYPGPVIHILQQRVILIDNANRRTISSCSNEGNQRNGRPPRKQSFTSPRKCLSLVEDDISEVWRPVFHIQFGDIFCVNLIRPRFCVLRITIGNQVQESSICNGRTVAANLSSKSASSKESIDGEKPISPRRKTGGEEEELNDSEMIRWPESFVFTNVPVYETKTALIEVLDVRPLITSEKTHGRVEILLTELTEFTNTSAEVKNINNRHSRKVSSKRRNSGNSFMQRSDHSNTSSGWYALEDLHSSYKIVDTNGLCASSRKDTKVRNKLNSYINILSADKPRSHIATPQLRICISVDQAL